MKATMIALVLACALSAPLAWGQTLPLATITPIDYEYTATAEFPPESGPVSNTTNFVHLAGFPGLVNRLNSLACPEANGLTLEQALQQLVGAPNVSPGCSSYRTLGGAYWNHALYFEIMAPFGSQTFEANASQELKDAILTKFATYEGMLQAVNTTAAARFGPGWLWMCITPNGTFDMITTTLQENPLSSLIMDTCTPFLGLDIWEHAYFLTYLSNRVQYTIDWFKVVNWAKVSEFYKLALAGIPPPVVVYAPVPSPQPTIPSPEPIIPSPEPIIPSPEPTTPPVSGVCSGEPTGTVPVAGPETTTFGAYVDSGSTAYVVHDPTASGVSLVLYGGEGTLEARDGDEGLTVVFCSVCCAIVVGPSVTDLTLFANGNGVSGIGGASISVPTLSLKADGSSTLTSDAQVASNALTLWANGQAKLELTNPTSSVASLTIPVIDGKAVLRYAGQVTGPTDIGVQGPAAQLVLGS